MTMENLQFIAQVLAFVSFIGLILLSVIRWRTDLNLQFVILCMVGFGLMLAVKFESIGALEIFVCMIFGSAILYRGIERSRMAWKYRKICRRNMKHQFARIFSWLGKNRS
ncbi:MAG: hypothetical protein IJ575_04415 [Selenomonadaceae bacterium]|nr:hypothetical protein [Selenomonadaceae bacterium]